MAEKEKPIGALVADLIETKRQIAATDHVGRINRLYRHQAAIFAAIDAAESGPQALCTLLDGTDADLAYTVATHCKFKGLCSEESDATLQRLGLRTDSMGDRARKFLASKQWEASMTRRAPPLLRSTPFAPAPKGVSLQALKQIVGLKMPKRSDALLGLARRSIRLWPRRAIGDFRESRFGGLPAVPANFEWPVQDDEPLLFLAQINCSEIRSKIDCPELPSTGLLSFFGDHDDVNGCSPTYSSAVFYFSYTNELGCADVPLENFEPLMSCGISVYESYELPHPYEQAVTVLKFSEAEWSAYIDLRVELAAVPSKVPLSEMREISKLMSCWYDISKLFGWPDLIQYGWPGNIAHRSWRGRAQDDEVELVVESSHRLLLQLGEYHDGTDSHGWGPGGLVYFMIEDESFAAQRFECAELAMQCS
ncbi:MAG: DUF1963 domain-containing protein [Methylovirgula sp.]